MFSRQQPGPNDATTSAGIGRNASPPIIRAPVPRRATSGSILTQDSSSDSEQYYPRRPFPNTPLQSSTPCVLNQQHPLNGVSDTQNNRATGGDNVHTPRRGHSRASSWGSVRSNLSPFSKKATRFSPTTGTPGQIHNPPPPGATPTRSAMRQTPSPARVSSQPQPHADSPVRTNSAPSIHIIQATPPSPNSQPTFAAHRPSVQPSGWQARMPGGSSPVDSDGSATPGQRMFRSRSPPPTGTRSGTPPGWRRSPSERGRNDDSGYFSPHSPVFRKSGARMSAVLSKLPQGTSSANLQQNQAHATASTNQGRSASPQVNRAEIQQRQSGSRIHASWQTPCSPDVCSPVIPDVFRYSADISRNHANPTPSAAPSRLSHAIPTPARPVRRATNADLAHINTSFSQPVGGQLSAQLRSSQTRPSHHHTPRGHARIASTPADGNRNVDSNAGSVVGDLLRVPPSSVAWHTPRGVLTWTPHPALPNSGPTLLGGGRGSGNGSGGRARDPDWWTGGYPMPGACPTWTPGAWPPAAASRSALIQLAPWMIPNPCNGSLPHIMWDISQSPTTAKRITGNHVIVNVMDKLEDVATHPAVDRLEVVCHVGVAGMLWGHIEVHASRSKGVTVWDVFNGIFEYFQKRVGRRELDRMKEMLGDEKLEEKMADAFYQRILVTPALPGYELKKGLKRVDCLGDACFFWGLYVSYNDDNTWQLNLGLVNRRRHA